MVRFNLSTIKNNKGFTLAEALVAVTIILVGIISIVTLAVTLTKASKLQQGKVVALNLAKEGLEVSKNIRDTNWLSNNNFFEGFQNSNFVVPVFNYDDRYVGQDTWFLDSINRNTKIYQDDDGIMFQEDGIIPPSETIFNRELEIKYIYQTDLATETVDPVFSYPALPGGDVLVGILVISRVNWSAQGIDQEIELEERLYNWKANAVK